VLIPTCSATLQIGLASIFLLLNVVVVDVGVHEI